MRDDITAMEKMIGMTVDQDPRKDTIVNQTAPGMARYSPCSLCRLGLG
jgi:hypothetical protein